MNNLIRELMDRIHEKSLMMFKKNDENDQEKKICRMKNQMHVKWSNG